MPDKVWPSPSPPPPFFCLNWMCLLSQCWRPLPTLYDRRVRWWTVRHSWGGQATPQSARPGGVPSKSSHHTVQRGAHCGLWSGKQLRNVDEEETRHSVDDLNSHPNHLIDHPNQKVPTIRWLGPIGPIGCSQLGLIGWCHWTVPIGTIHWVASLFFISCFVLYNQHLETEKVKKKKHN